MKMSTRRITFLALLTALVLIVSLIESMLPSPIALAPGAKLGLGNIAPLIALIVLGAGDAFVVMLLKCLLGALVSGRLSGLLYSVPSGVVALIVEIILFRTLFDKVSVGLISLVGAVAFNAMQVLVASLVTGVNLAALLPWMCFAGMLAGAFSGLLTYYVIKRLPYSVYGIGRRYDSIQ